MPRKIRHEPECFFQRFEAAFSFRPFRTAGYNKRSGPDALSNLRTSRRYNLCYRVLCDPSSAITFPCCTVTASVQASDNRATCVSQSTLGLKNGLEPYVRIHSSGFPVPVLKNRTMNQELQNHEP